MVRLLVVDEDMWMCDFLWDFFTPKKYEVFTALNKITALGMIRNFKPQIVLLELSKNGMDGIDILKAIINIDPDIGVIMTTHAENEALAKESLKMGARDYTIKPFNLDYLEGVVSILTAYRPSTK
jgi:DNA-binding NtrC family response regulator